MTITTRHTVEEALTKFELVSGAGDGKQTACAMSMLNWICYNTEKGWSDAPECAHGLIRQVVIRANDAAGVTPEMRGELVKAGEHGILDTWWIPTEVVVQAMSAERGTVPTEYDRALAMVQRIAAWKLDKAKPNLTGANLTGAYLTGANLTRANLTGANLAGANLTGANLAGADLAGANLAGANLAGADLTGADLAGANLAGANLTGANLTGANLAGANLTGADLTGANLTGANLTGADLTGADLTSGTALDGPTSPGPTSDQGRPHRGQLHGAERRR